MTLKEAFNQWSVAPRNSVLANRSRDAVNKVLLKEYGDTDLELIDETFAREIFLGSDVAQELKTKAASILVYVLQWGGDHGRCDRPSFDYSIARKPEVKPADKPKGRKKPQKNTEDTENKSVESVGDKKEADQTTPDPSYSGGETSGGDEPSGKPEASDKTAAASPPEFLDEPSGKAERGGDRGGLKKRTIRKVDDDICQLDTKTLEVVKKWPHAHRIMQELGIGNVVRAIERCGIAGGFYWTYARDLDTFSERLAARQEHNAQVHADHCAQMRAAKNPQKENKPRTDTEDTEKKKKTSKKTAAASPPELGGARGGLKKRKDVSPVQTTPAPPDSGGEAAAEKPRRSAASKALEVFTDDELFEELDRRGWFCVLSRTEIVTIGSK